MWSTHWPALPALIDRVEAELPVVRQRLSGRLLPSEDGDPAEPIALPVTPGAAVNPGWGVEAGALRTGPLSAGRLRFQLADSQAEEGKVGVVVGVSGKSDTALPRESAAIPIGADVSSLIFLHALARPAANEFAFYRSIYDFDDSADLMGCYEVVYEDGLVTTIPIRYGVNILEWSWSRHDKPDSYPLPTPVSYGARAVEIGQPGGTRLTFFALEWPNPRLGKKNQGSSAARFDGLPNRREKQQRHGKQCDHSPRSQCGPPPRLPGPREGSNRPGGPLNGQRDSSKLLSPL